MRVRTIGIILIIIGLLGGVTTSASGILTKSYDFYTLGIVANVIQVVGIFCLILDI